MIKGFERYNDYCFDYKTFKNDPEGYQFTEDDIMYLNLMEFEDYEQAVPMTRAEKQALRKWVASGHSVRETPPSKYACIYPSHPEPDFLDVYRTDKELDKATKGMSAKECIAYLKEYIGDVDETEDERQEREKRELLYRQTPDKAKEKIRMLNRQLHYTWMYLVEEGIWEEADEFVKEHMDEPTPFEDEW